MARNDKDNQIKYHSINVDAQMSAVEGTLHQERQGDQLVACECRSTGHGKIKEIVQHPAFKVHQPSNNLHDELCVHLSSRGGADACIPTNLMVLG